MAGRPLDQQGRLRGWIDRISTLRLRLDLPRSQLDGGRVYPAKASADASGVVTVQVKTEPREYDYQFINTFRDMNSFDAVEGFLIGPLKGRTMSKAYSRCG
jgi:hypothetical protein